MTKQERILSTEEQKKVIGGAKAERKSARTLITLPSGRKFLVHSDTASDSSKLQAYLAKHGVTPGEMGVAVASAQ